MYYACYFRTIELGWKDDMWYCRILTNSSSVQLPTSGQTRSKNSILAQVILSLAED